MFSKNANIQYLYMFSGIGLLFCSVGILSGSGTVLGLGCVRLKGLGCVKGFFCNFSLILLLILSFKCWTIPSKSSFHLKSYIHYILTRECYCNYPYVAMGGKLRQFATCLPLNQSFGLQLSTALFFIEEHQARKLRELLWQQEKRIFGST